MKRFAHWLLPAPALILVATLLLAPVAGVLLLTLGSGRAVAIYQTFLGSGFNQTVIGRTLQIATLTTLISLPVGFIAAYVVVRAPRSIKSLLIIAAVFPLLTSVVVRSFAFMVLLGRNGVVNNLLMNFGLIEEPLSLLYTQAAVIIGLVYLFTPLMILSLVGVLEGIENDLLQASASLGASPAATFRQVILPLAAPGLIVGAVLVFTGSFTAFATPQLLGGDRQMVLATLLYEKAMVSFDWITASTIALIMLLINIAVVLFMSATARRLNPAAV